jgi:signal transduction histidine kinase
MNGRPRSLQARLLLVLLAGLVLAHGLTFVLVLAERSLAMRGMMVGYLASDVASSVAVLERLPADERPQWAAKLSRRNYRLRLEALPAARAASSALAQDILREMAQALGAPRALRIVDGAAPGTALRLGLPLADGTPLVVELDEPRLRISPWAWAALAAQLLLLAGLSVWAVRTATRPLRQLARAADGLQPEAASAPLPEDGPSEVRTAASAFNRMQQRIRTHLAERMHILAAVSHDLQTPLTRMRLRADLLDDEGLREKLHADLAEMQSLVQEGIAYARSAHAVGEPAQRLDVQALIRSLVMDYADAGRPVSAPELAELQATTRPQALRRLLVNLVDNALKFAGSAELRLAVPAGGGWTVQVLDRGPGIPPADVERVMQPFVRLEDSRHRGTGGTGLGLAIASQLAQGLGARLRLLPRDGGGLEARLDCPPSDGDPERG